MPDGTITITGDTGPGLTMTAQTFTGVKSMNFQVGRNVLTIESDGIRGPLISDVSLTGVTTVTYSISSGVATVVVS